MKTFFLTLVIWLGLVIIGCNQTEKSESTSIDNAFSIHLAIAANTPVPVNSRLILDVSAFLDPATVNDNTVYLQKLDQTHHPVNITLLGKQIIIQPKIYLKPETTYEIIITTDLYDIDGNNLSQENVISFTSDVAIDTTSPTLLKTLPLNYSSTMEIYGIIYYQLSEPLSPLYDSNLVTLYDDNNTSISGVTTVRGSLVSFHPDNNLTAGVNYRVELNTSSITDLSGNAYSGPSMEEINFSITSAPISLASWPENSTQYQINGKINCIHHANITTTNSEHLFIGSDQGLEVLRFNFNNTSSQDSTFSPVASLSAAQVGTVYDIDINVSSQRAYLATSTGFYIIDINLLSLSIVSEYSVVETDSLIPIYGLTVVSQTAYLAATTKGLVALDISDESNISESFVKTSSGTLFDVMEVDNTLVSSLYNDGVIPYEMNGTLQSPYSPSITGHVHNIVSYYGAYSGRQEASMAAGIDGLAYTSGNSINAYPIASYVSQIAFNDSSFYSPGLLHELGIVRFLPANINSTPPLIQEYQLLPYKVTSVEGIVFGNYDAAVIFAADNSGTIHIFYP